jgi:hypothetical protein
MPIAVQVQMSPGCGHGERTVALVRDVLAALDPGARVEVVEVSTAEDAARLGFRGSPTVLVDGTDIDPRPPAGLGLG